MPEPAPQLLTFMGAPGSPYTRKMRAVLRYRRIPYRFLISGAGGRDDLPAAKVRLLPTFYLPNEAGELEAVVGSNETTKQVIEATADDWIDREPPATLRALLGEVGRVYAPFLLANAEALMLGAERVDCEIDGRPWVQKPFPYQGKCLMWLRGQYAELSAGDRAVVDGLLAGAGCESLLEREAVS